MPPSYADDPRLRRFCRDQGLSPGAARQLGTLVEALVAEHGGHTRLTTGVLDALDATSARAAPTLPAGDRYEDLGRIGAGATGDVRRVRDRWMGRTLAMKVLHKALLGHAGAIARFQREAALTATLHHPGVVVVHDQGTTEDGRPWFTMQEVQGRTFRAVLADGEWSLQRRVDAFARACQAVAYAHSRGVLHRDLKPDNVMTGAFGVVLVMDWGLACRVDDVALLAAERGVALGTPGYMAPEVAAGEGGGEAGDVYALGATLWHLLTGRAPVGEITAGSEPPELVALARAALAHVPAERPRASVLAEEAVSWLDGARRREQARALLEHTLARLPKVAELQAAGAEAREAAEAARRAADVAQRRAGWAREQEADALSREAALAEAEVERELHAALNLDPGAEAVHAQLADLYQDRMRRAEARGDADAASISEVLLRAHDRGRHAAWLRGDAALTLRTAPAGARVTLHPWVEQDRRLVPGNALALGVTPLLRTRVPHGSHLLVVEADGYEPMRVPIVTERLGEWDGSAPLPMLPRGVAPEACYVPAGWFRCGGDPDAADSLPRRTLWVDGFVIRRFPVTHAEWLAFVRAEDAAGREVEDLLPRTRAERLPIYVRGAGGWEAGPDDRGLVWAPDWPITQITWHAARRYCAAQPPILGQPWRLPDEVEWEKAARGVDGRLWPWGRHFEAAVVNMAAAPGPPACAVVHAFPDDVSLYGVRGLAGNVRDVCANAWTSDGDLPADGHLRLREAGPTDALVVLRGGCWYSAAAFCRPANRLVERPDEHLMGAGFRMVASVRG